MGLPGGLGSQSLGFVLNTHSRVFGVCAAAGYSGRGGEGSQRRVETGGDAYSPHEAPCLWGDEKMSA